MARRPKSERLSRSWILYLFANGALKYAAKGDSRQLDLGGLPVGSVSSEEQASDFQAMFCKLSREDNRTYHLPWPSENDADYEERRQLALQLAGDFIEDWWQIQADGVTGIAPWAPFLKYKKALGLDDESLLARVNSELAP